LYKNGYLLIDIFSEDERDLEISVKEGNKGIV